MLFSRNLNLDNAPAQSFEPLQRSRSGSLNERKAANIGGQRDRAELGALAQAGSGAVQLQEELVEAADDFLKQYSQGACSLQPRKSAAERFLVNGGQSNTWVAGNKVSLGSRKSRENAQVWLP